MGKKDKHPAPKKQKAAQRGGKAEEEGGAASERSKKDRKQQVGVRLAGRWERGLREGGGSAQCILKKRACGST